MRALFITTATSEPRECVKAWKSTGGTATQVTFDINGPRNDDEIIGYAKDYCPDVIFYTGGVSGDGLPSDETLKEIKSYAPSVIIQGDMADPPFFPVLERYRNKDCFDRYVAIDGVHGSPADHVTLTPINLEHFDQPQRSRTIRCGFAGNIVNRDRYEMIKKMHGTEDPRAKVIHGLGDLVRLRERETEGLYVNFVAFLRRCQMIINTSWAGSGLVHHMKGRVLEAAFAGCALLEMKGSPIADWFPPESYFMYDGINEAKEIIRHTSDSEIERRAKLLEIYAREHYRPEHIFSGIVAKL